MRAIGWFADGFGDFLMTTELEGFLRASVPELRSKFATRLYTVE